eukprot:11198995-Lingulodinium_polyedra.AAC.1
MREHLATAPNARNAVALGLAANMVPRATPRLPAGKESRARRRPSGRRNGQQTTRETGTLLPLGPTRAG